MKTKTHSQSGFLGSRGLIALFFCVATSSITTATLLGFFRAEMPPKVSDRTLTFEQRVAYQRSIEEVYLGHRFWPKGRPDPKPSLDAVMSQAQLEKKVTDYLRNSQALEDYWKQPLTAEQLQAEMDRMAEHTKQPEVLQELFEALGNDPFVIAECLARPVLAERLLTERLGGSSTPSLDDKSNREAIKNSRPSDFVTIVRGAADPPDAAYTLPIRASPSGGCIDDTWTATSTGNAPTARDFHTAVWTGSEMIVWGGLNGGNTGGRYNPSTDSWTATSTTNAPTGRAFHTAVWTGSEMIVWGGDLNPGLSNTGGRYSPSTDSWTATSTTNAPTARK